MNWHIGEWFLSVRRTLSSRYVRMLEDERARGREEVARERAEVERERAEIARLRLENRAMLNSLLGTAGVPPVEEPSAYRAGGAQPVAPIRRHFWRPPV